jgi:hypothetical protein
MARLTQRSGLAPLNSGYFGAGHVTGIIGHDAGMMSYDARTT